MPRKTISPRSRAAYKAWETRRAQGWVHPGSKLSKVAVTPAAKQPTLEERVAQLEALLKANGIVAPAEPSKRSQAAFKAHHTRRKAA